MMRIAIVLYALAGILLTATITHYLSREAFIRRTDQVIDRVLSNPEITKNPDDSIRMNRVTKMFSLSAKGPCLLALVLFAPFLSCIYGAIAIHLGVVRGKPRSLVAVAAGMALMFLLGIILSAAAVPC